MSFEILILPAEKSWLQTDIADTYLLDLIAKYPAEDNPRKIIFDDLIEPRRWIERTHLIAEDIMRMKKDRIFTILRKNRPRNLLAHLRLGYCVTHNLGHPKCQQEGQTCALQCHICGVCCHMYSCTCRLVKGFQWCSHIHAAVLCGGNKFKNDQQVYLHISARYTQLSHLRATCYDMTNDVKPVENNEDAFAVIGWTTEWTSFSVLRSSQMEICHKCPQYKRCPECSTCRHQYVCTCAEYMVNKRLCEHCHVVAIFLSENKVNILRKRNFNYLSDVSEDTDEEADPKTDNSPIMLPLRKIFAHHEKSYSIPLRRIQVISVNNQLIYLIQRCDPERTFVISTKNRLHCTCSKDSVQQNMGCTDCKMCRHSLTCNCGKEDIEFCKHTHAVRRYIMRCYSDTNAESAVESVTSRALKDFNESCPDGSSLVTEANIMAVIQSLKLVLENEVEIKLPNVDELSISCGDSTKNSVHNLEPVIEDVNQISNIKNESSGQILTDIKSCRILNSDSFEKDIHCLEPVLSKNDNPSGTNFNTAKDSGHKLAAEINEWSFSTYRSAKEDIHHLEPVLSTSLNDGNTKISAEISGLNPLNSGSIKKSEFSLKPILEKNCNEETTKAESDVKEQNSELKNQPVQKTDFVGDYSDASSMARIESQVKPVNVLKPVQEKNCKDDTSTKKSKYRRSTEVDVSLILDTNYKLGDCRSDACRMGRDVASAEISWSIFSNGNSPENLDSSEPVLSSGGENDIGTCEKEKNKPDYSEVKTLRSFYDLHAEPVLELCYKGNSDTNKEGYPKVLAESSKCIVIINDPAKQTAPNSVLLLPQTVPSDSKEDDKNKVPDESFRLSIADENSKLHSSEGAPNSNPDLLKVPLPGFNTEQNGKNRDVIETCRFTLLPKDFRQHQTKKSVSNLEPVLPENLSCSCVAERKDENSVSIETNASSVVDENFEKSSTKANAPSEPVLFEYFSSDFGLDEDDINLIPIEASESTSTLGINFKKKSRNFMQKLKLAKYCKRPQKKKILSRIFGNKSWTGLHQHTEFTNLQSTSGENSKTNVIYENL